MINLEPIAYIHTDFPEKFGVPRQSGLIEELHGTIIFEPKYRDALALKGIEEFTYLWLLWEFEGVDRENWLKQVRPPRLGGNETRGVFATRSPFRPNPIGLSSVKIVRIDYEAENGPIIVVSGIDIKDNTPIYDIKPYLEYVDSHPGAGSGFADDVKNDSLTVYFPSSQLGKLPSDKKEGLKKVLRDDPRPHYQNDPERVYGITYAGFNIKFKVDQAILTVTEVTELEN